MRYLFIFLAVIVVALLYNSNWGSRYNNNLPTFMKEDKIVDAHHTRINISIQSMIKPDDESIRQLVIDYNAIWAHLQYLYATGDVNAGKEYYTQNWFKSICSSNPAKFTNDIQQEDIEHDLKISNWSTDGLVCTLYGDIAFRYTTKDFSCSELKRVSIVLLQQGDHWRLEAIHFKFTNI